MWPASGSSQTAFFGVVALGKGVGLSETAILAIEAGYLD